MNLDGLPLRSVSDRLEQFRIRLGSAGLEAYWLVKPANVRYLSGFTGDESTLLVTRDASILVTDSRFEEQAQEEAEVDEIVVRHKQMAKTVGMVCRGQGSPKVGFTAGNVTYADGRALASELPRRRVLPSTKGLAERMRQRKGRDEVETIVRATRLAEAAFREFVDELAPGQSEKWLSGRLEWGMKRRGADGKAFDTICAVGERASLPHAICTDREMGPESPLLVDWGARLKGYHSDLTRVVGTGTMPRLIRDIAEVVLRAQKAAFGEIGPGVACSDVDHAAREVIVQAGYGPFFGHSLGHGVGLEVHEAPRLSAGVEQVLLPGMVVTVEPGIYLPGRGGVRIEDLLVITTTGYERLSSAEPLIGEAWQ